MAFRSTQPEHVAGEARATTGLAVKQTQTQGACLAMALSSGCDPGQGYKGASVSAGHGAHLGQARPGAWRVRAVGLGVPGERRLEVSYTGVWVSSQAVPSPP